MNPKIILLLLTLSLSTCEQKAGNAAVESKMPSVERQTPPAFEDFLAQFNKDTSFQLEHIIFPLDVFLYQEEEDFQFKEVSEPLTIGEWEHTSLEYNQENTDQAFDAFTQQTVSREDSSFVQFRGVNNGIYVDYVFAIKNNDWFLVAIKDYSM